jgi:hypothetical protein
MQLFSEVLQAGSKDDITALQNNMSYAEGIGAGSIPLLEYDLIHAIEDLEQSAEDYAENYFTKLNDSMKTIDEYIVKQNIENYHEVIDKIHKEVSYFKFKISNSSYSAGVLSSMSVPENYRANLGFRPQLEFERTAQKINRILLKNCPADEIEVQEKPKKNSWGEWQETPREFNIEEHRGREKIEYERRKRFDKMMKEIDERDGYVLPKDREQ